MTGFTADPDELRDAATALHALVAEYRNAAVTRYSMSSDEVGNDELADAFDEFIEVSEAVHRKLPDDVDETALRLAGNATHYADLDENLADELRKHAHGDD